MTLNSNQLQQLCEMYAEELVDKMDMKTMEQFVFDTIMQSVECMGENDLLNEISNYFDDEDLSKMITSVGADPDTIL